jgi:hypothetical protein
MVWCLMDVGSSLCNKNWQWKPMCSMKDRPLPLLPQEQPQHDMNYDRTWSFAVRIHLLTAWAINEPLALMTLILWVWKFDAKSIQRHEFVEGNFQILGLRPFREKVSEQSPNHGVSEKVSGFFCRTSGTLIFCSSLCANPPWCFCFKNTVSSSKAYFLSNFFQPRNVQSHQYVPLGLHSELLQK